MDEFIDDLRGLGSPERQRKSKGAERRVIEAAKAWVNGMPGAGLLIAEAVRALQEAERA